MTKDSSTSRLVRKLRTSVRLSTREIAAIQGVQGRPQSFAAGSDLITAGRRSRSIRVIEDGWAYRYTLLPDGRRQVINFVLPGDITGFNESFFGERDYSVTTLTPARIVPIAPHRMMRLYSEYPRLAAALAWSVARYESMLVEQIVRLGRRNAFERIAHFLLELHKRLQAVGLAGEDSYRTPLTQEILADTLGLSVVHVNRTLGRLKRQGLVSMSDGRVVLRDITALATIADFDAGYLL